MSGYSLICCVVNHNVGSKTLKVAKKYGVKGATISLGHGTVNNRLLDFLCLNDVRKEIVTMVIEKELAHAAMVGIGKDMEFHKPNHGIAFSLLVSDFIGSKNAVAHNLQASEINQKIDAANQQTNEVASNMYKIIYVVVDKGRAEDVIDAANRAGARGGTIINARGSGIHEVQKLFSMEIEPEKEEVFIITESALKDDIVASIRSDLKIDEPGTGILFVMDVDEAYGLH